LLSLTLLVGCGTTRVDPAIPESEPESARVWNYRVEAIAGARELHVRATLPPGVPAELELDRFASPYLRDLELRTARGWRSLPGAGESWLVPECRALGCELRYRFLLAQAATEIDRFGFAALRGGVLLAPPSTWLLHPLDYQGRDLYRLQVNSDAQTSFVSGVWPSPRADGTREAPAELLFQAPYSAFGRFREQRVAVRGGLIHASIGLDGGALALTPEALDSALSTAGRVLADYFGRFPVRDLAVIVVPVAGSEVLGMQLGNGGASILLFLGREVTDISPEHDWVLVHEMFHLGLPTLARRHLWLAEGLATYQEPLARARAGFIDERQLWREFLSGMPKGLPGPGAGGLDGSRSWGRTYWGGALFCLLADLTIRRRSAQRFSLDDALRGIWSAGGDTSVRWSAAQTFAVGDRASGGSTLSELYREHADAAVPVDLDAIFARLGVRWRDGKGGEAEAGDAEGRELVFDDAAEWAGLRRALSAATGRQGAQAGLASPGVPKSPL
jgi:hypothetical protein